MNTEQLLEMQRTIQQLIAHKNAAKELQERLNSMTQVAAPPVESVSQPVVLKTYVTYDGMRVGEDFNVTRLPEVTKEVPKDRGDTLIPTSEVMASNVVTSVARKKQKRLCGTPGCNLFDNHSGPHSHELCAKGPRVSSKDVCCKGVVLASKRRRVCGTPGCALPDGHIGPHETEALEAVRPRVEMSYSGMDCKETVDDPEEEEEEAEPESTKQAVEKKLFARRNFTIVSERLAGSVPTLVAMDGDRLKRTTLTLAATRETQDSAAICSSTSSY